MNITPDSLRVAINDRIIRTADVEATPNPSGSVPFPTGPDQALRKMHKKSHYKLSKHVS